MVLLYTTIVVYKTEYKSTIHILSYQYDWHYTMGKQLPSAKIWNR